MCIPTIRELPYMTDFLKIAKSIAVHFAHICAYGVETVKGASTEEHLTTLSFAKANRVRSRDEQEYM